MSKKARDNSNKSKEAPTNEHDDLGGEFRIDYNAQWFHDDVPINRKALAKLFADRALKRDEDGKYWLQTPYEKYPVQVADVPFVIVDYSDELGEIDLITNMGDVVPLGPDNRLGLRQESLRGDSVPYVEVRDGLRARLSRSVFMELAEKALAQGKTSIRSRGVDHPLGSDM